jgi:hypothetical protein
VPATILETVAYGNLADNRKRRTSVRLAAEMVRCGTGGRRNCVSAKNRVENAAIGDVPNRDTKPQK